MAKQPGEYTGASPPLTAEQAQRLREGAASGERKSTLATEFGISRETVYADHLLATAVVAAKRSSVRQ